MIALRSQTESPEFDALDCFLKKMHTAAQAGDREAFYDADLAWHQELWRLSGNEFLAQSLEQIVVPLFAFFIMLYVRRDNNTESFLEAVSAHEKVLLSLRGPRPDRAASAIRELVDLSLKHQQGLISGQPA